MDIEKIRNIGLDKLVTQVYDFDSLTTDELMCKFAQKINIIIEHLKYIDDRCYNSDKAIELKLQYLLGQGLEEQVAKRLIELINKGTIGNLINESLLKNINDKVDEFKVQVNEQLDSINNNLNEMEIHKNSKATLVYFCDNAWRQTIDFFTNLVELGKKAGFTETNILIHINSDGTISEDLTKFPQYAQIAKEKGVPITSLKVHGSYTSTNYVENIYDTLDVLPEIDTVFIFNEQFNSVYSNGLTLANQIKLKYPNIKKVGCTVDYKTAFKNYNPTVVDEYKTIQENYDILGVHMYPSCGSYDESKNTTYEQCLNSFNDFQLLIPWEKEIWITESGVLPYWQFLELPESYNLNLLTDKNRTIEPQIIFYKALFNCNMCSKAKKIIPWYTESWVYDDTIKIWDYLKNIIVGQ